MLRIVVLTGAVLFTTMLYAYAGATPAQQAKFPSPVRTVLSNSAHAVASARSEFDRVASGDVGKSANALMTRLVSRDAPRPTALTAMNEDLSDSTFLVKLMPQSTLIRSNLDRTIFQRSILDGSMLDSASFRQAQFVETDLSSVTARGTDFSGAGFVGTKMTGAMVQSALFDGAMLAKSDVSSAQFSGASLRNARISGSVATDAIFYRADLIGAEISDSILRRANLSEALLVGAVISDVDLTGASLKDADLSGADLRFAAGLTQDQLDAACGTGLTRLPRGLRIRDCNSTDNLAFVRTVSDTPAP